MKTNASKASYVYLILVPVVAGIIGFGVGHIYPHIYVPVWLLNVALMCAACWKLGLFKSREGNRPTIDLAWAAFLLIVPWILISMFAGLGPPPETAALWVQFAKEQQVRYFMLVISGICLILGFARLRESLRLEGDGHYSMLSFASLLVALPLFLINMLYWGFFLPAFFELHVKNNWARVPDWLLPMQELFGMISVVEVALTYLATMFIVMAIRKAGWFSRMASSFYILFSVLGFVIIVLSAFFKFLDGPAFAVSIPAVPMLMPYFIGVNLLKYVGDRS